MTFTRTKRLATAVAAGAVLLSGGLAAAPAATASPVADDSRAVSRAKAEGDEGPSPRKKVKLRDGCFSGSYDDDTWASVTLYFKNRCKRAHRLHIDATGAGGEDKTVTVKGHTKGSKRYWNWTSGFDIYDYGRA